MLGANSIELAIIIPKITLIQQIGRFIKEEVLMVEISHRLEMRHFNSL